MLNTNEMFNKYNNYVGFQKGTPYARYISDALQSGCLILFGTGMVIINLVLKIYLAQSLKMNNTIHLDS